MHVADRCMDGAARASFFGCRAVGVELGTTSCKCTYRHASAPGRTTPHWPCNCDGTDSGRTGCNRKACHPLAMVVFTSGVTRDAGGPSPGMPEHLHETGRARALAPHRPDPLVLPLRRGRLAWLPMHKCQPLAADVWQSHVPGRHDKGLRHPRMPLIPISNYRHTRTGSNCRRPRRMSAGVWAYFCGTMRGVPRPQTRE